MDNKRKDLAGHRMNQSKDSLKAAKICFENNILKDAINRSYYAAFYAIKAVLALEEVDFRRHKDVIAYFNKTYVAAGMFPKELGRKTARLQQIREKSDYDDFFIISRNDAQLQMESAELIIKEVGRYLVKEFELHI